MDDDDTDLPEVGGELKEHYWRVLYGIADKSAPDIPWQWGFNALLCAEFNRTIPVPSLSTDNANFSHDGICWRGGVWASTN